MPLSISVIGRLEHQHETISELIAGIPEMQLKKRVHADKWSVFENITHLAAYQPTFMQRLTLILEGNKPRFERYVADNDPLFYEYLKKPLNELLLDISTKRSIINAGLINLDEGQLKLAGHHPKFGYIPVGKWVEFFLLHEAHHLFAIMQLIGELHATQQ